MKTYNIYTKLRLLVINCEGGMSEKVLLGTVSEKNKDLALQKGINLQIKKWKETDLQGTIYERKGTNRIKVGDIIYSFYAEVKKDV